MVLHEQLGLLLANDKITGKVIYTATDMLLETRAVINPCGDYLLMFPTNTKEKPKGGCHYNGQNEKVNDLVAFRSYMDMFVDDGVLNLFVPHRWQRALHLQIHEDTLSTLPTIETLRRKEMKG